MNYLDIQLRKIEKKFIRLSPVKRRFSVFLLSVTMLFSGIAWEVIQTRHYRQEMKMLKTENSELRRQMYSVMKYSTQRGEPVKKGDARAVSGNKVSEKKIIRDAAKKPSGHGNAVDMGSDLGIVLR